MNKPLVILIVLISAISALIVPVIHPFSLSITGGPSSKCVWVTDSVSNYSFYVGPYEVRILECYYDCDVLTAWSPYRGSYPKYCGYGVYKIEVYRSGIKYATGYFFRDIGGEKYKPCFYDMSGRLISCGRRYIYLDGDALKLEISKESSGTTAVEIKAEVYDDVGYGEGECIPTKGDKYCYATVEASKSSCKVQVDLGNTKKTFYVFYGHEDEYNWGNHKVALWFKDLDGVPTCVAYIYSSGNKAKICASYNIDSVRKLQQEIPYSYKTVSGTEKCGMSCYYHKMMLSCQFDVPIPYGSLPVAGSMHADFSYATGNTYYLNFHGLHVGYVPGSSYPHYKGSSLPYQYIGHTNFAWTPPYWGCSYDHRAYISYFLTLLVRPDYDLDGIIDYYDPCPYSACGCNECIDSDNDKVPDYADPAPFRFCYSMECYNDSICQSFGMCYKTCFNLYRDSSYCMSYCREYSESCLNSEDCACKPYERCTSDGLCVPLYSGDGICSPRIGENCMNSKDCVCPEGKYCNPYSSQADEIGCVSPFCGDGICRADENCETCPADCACAEDMVCMPEHPYADISGCVSYKLDWKLYIKHKYHEIVLKLLKFLHIK